MSLAWVFLVLVPLALAQICPMEKHQICNQDNSEHTCTCAVSADDERAVPYQSCNKMIDRGEDEEDEDDQSFEAVSIKFNLDESNAYEEFPEDQFKETIATSLRVDEDDILLLRVNCEGTDDTLTVQFAILKKDNNETEMPYEQNDFVDAESIVTRMKAMGHLDKIADLDVDEIKEVKELIDIEFDPNNTELIIQAIFMGAAFTFMFGLGIFMCVRNQGYSDDLQKA